MKVNGDIPIVETGLVNEGKVGVVRLANVAIVVCKDVVSVDGGSRTESVGGAGRGVTTMSVVRQLYGKTQSAR
jgi:hypothetical protein